MVPNLAYGRGCLQSRDYNLDFTIPFTIRQTPLSLPVGMNCTQQTCFLQRKDLTSLFMQQTIQLVLSLLHIFVIGFVV